LRLNELNIVKDSLKYIPNIQSELKSISPVKYLENETLEKKSFRQKL